MNSLFQSLPAMRPGQVPTAEDWNNMRAAIERVSRLLAGPGLAVRNVGQQSSIESITPQKIKAKITAGPDTNGAYTWVEVTRDGTSFVQTGARSGSPSAGQPAYENNGNSTPIGSIVDIWPASNGQAWEFIFLDDCCVPPPPAPDPQPSPGPTPIPIGGGGDCRSCAGTAACNSENLVWVNGQQWCSFDYNFNGTIVKGLCQPTTASGHWDPGPGWQLDYLGCNWIPTSPFNPAPSPIGPPGFGPPGGMPPIGTLPPVEDCVAYAYRACANIPYGSPEWVRCYNANLQSCLGGGGGAAGFPGIRAASAGGAGGCGCDGTCGDCGGSGRAASAKSAGGCGCGGGSMAPAPNPAPNPVGGGLLELVQARLNNAVIAPTVSATLAANQNNYAPGSTGLLRVQTDGSGAKNITGLSINQIDGQIVSVENIGTVDNINLVLNSGSSSTANQWNNGVAAGNDVVAPGAIVTYRYSGGSAGLGKWRKII